MNSVLKVYMATVFWVYSIFLHHKSEVLKVYSPGSYFNATVNINYVASDSFKLPS